VVGVMKNFIYGDMYGKTDPLIFLCRPSFGNYMYIRLNEGKDIEKLVAQIQNVMKADNPGFPFDYKFVNDEFNELFKSEMLIGVLSRVFAFLAIFISCLGLFGLAAYTAERRTKEIGIRKVLGASVQGITTLLSTDFLKLVLISVGIAFPVSWWMMHKWLQDYTYRISISWVVFVIAGCCALLIAFLTISFQAIKAALSSPIKNLRTE
jgi:ABC-type antimicrobial peptide transport system permease subunit